VTRLHEQIETVLSPEAAFDYIADFANAAEWDPGTERSERVDAGPVGAGARYRLDVRIGSRIAPMEYRITAFERPHRVVLEGTGSGVTALDEIRFAPKGEGSRIDYTADIRLGGLLRLVQPFLRRAFERVGRDAASGMRQTLDARAAGAAPGSAARP
jgi:carbon monoxide dehydrogenase subunit G